MDRFFGTVPLFLCYSSCFIYIGSLAEIQKITFDGCSEFPCIVHHGSHATGQATLVARSTTNSLECKVGFGRFPFEKKSK
jgi:hypothetical protein